ncbi:MAG: FAD-binding oxidoreductase [Planctomycetes bacterium]|nr:FAD-binding oxidoreductase [Planctomycetota bacterium]
MSPTDLVARLTALVGADRVSIDPARLKEAARDLTEIRGTPPDVIVRPGEVAHVQAVLRFANAGKIPVVPVVMNTNIGGLALPSRGGILLDMTAMNRILEVHPEDLYMVIEPGVLFGQVKEHLDRNFPQTRFAYSLSPPETSVLANTLMDGLLNLSLRYGTSSTWLNGVEAVLADGTIVRTGAAGWSTTQWCTSSPMPDLTGLFVNLHGTTGIVTKASVRLQQAKRLRRRYFMMGYDVRAACALVRDFVREDICDDIGILTWPVAKMLFGELRPTWREPGEPLVMTYVDVTSNRQAEMDLRESILAEVLETSRKSGARWEGPLDVRDLIKIEPAFRKLAEFPTRLDFMLDHPGGGLSWVGTYGPTSRWEEATELSCRIMVEHGFPPIAVARPMAQGHFGVLRLIETFNRDKPEEVEAVAKLNKALVEALLPMGFIPYKTPEWVFREHGSKIDPGFREMLRRVRTALDPNGIMNPGKWPV